MIVEAPRNPCAACYNAVWNFAIGCSHVGRGCKNCCVQQLAGTYWQFAEKGVTQLVKGRWVWNGHVWIAPLDNDEVWLAPQLWPGSAAPKVDDRSLIFVNLMSDVCHESIPAPISRLAFWAIAASRHVGMFPSKRYARLAALIASASAEEAHLWKPKSLLGFSVADQAEFDEAWPHLRPLAEAGWAVFASLSPLLERIRLPDDFLALARWCIVSGEQGPRARCHDMDPDWARAVRDQCDQAGIPFFLREMSRDEPIPNDLLRRDFPSLKPQPSRSRIINLRGTNGSGKSTLARRFLTEPYRPRPLYGCLGAGQPEAYQLSVPGVGHQVFLLGPYGESNCGGCDRIQPYDLILELLNKYVERGHVLLEGSLVSDNYGRIGDWLTARGRNATVLFLDTPLETCLERLRARTTNAGEKHVAKRFQAIKRVRQKFIVAGKVRVVDASCDEAYGEMMRLLNEG